MLFLAVILDVFFILEINLRFSATRLGFFCKKNIKFRSDIFLEFFPLFWIAKVLNYKIRIFLYKIDEKIK